MRGKESCHLKPGKVKGITPAHAGKRPQGQFVRPLFQDHPRACGEKWNMSRTGLSIAGSPPRMRGKVFGDIAVPAFTGITPAHAGKRTRKM